MKSLLKTLILILCIIGTQAFSENYTEYSIHRLLRKGGNSKGSVSSGSSSSSRGSRGGEAYYYTPIDYSQYSPEDSILGNDSRMAIVIVVVILIFIAIIYHIRNPGFDSQSYNTTAPPLSDADKVRF